MEYINYKHHTTRILQTAAPKKYSNNTFQDNRNTSNVLQRLIIRKNNKYDYNSLRGIGFLEETKNAIPIKPGEQICHKISFNNLQIIIVTALNNHNFEKLDNLANELNCSTSELKTKYNDSPSDYVGITNAANDLLEALNNAEINLRAGSGHINQGIRNHFDPNFEQHDGQNSMTPGSKKLHPFSITDVMIKNDEVRSSTSGRVNINTLSPKTATMFGFPPIVLTSDYDRQFEQKVMQKLYSHPIIKALSLPKEEVTDQLPICADQIKSRVDAHSYSSIAEFWSDINHLFQFHELYYKGTPGLLIVNEFRIITNRLKNKYKKNTGIAWRNKLNRLVSKLNKLCENSPYK